MKKIILSCFLIAGMASCKIGYKKVKFNGEKIVGVNDYPSKYEGMKPNCSMFILRGFDELIGVNGLFFYPDSSIIYFATWNNCPNSMNIKLLSDSIYDYRFQFRELMIDFNEYLGRDVYRIRPDTMELSGIDADSLCWKDVVYDAISVGYLKVPLKNKEKYDNCLKTVKMDWKEMRKRPMFW